MTINWRYLKVRCTHFHRNIEQPSQPQLQSHHHLQSPSQAEQKSPWVFQIISCPSTVPAARLQPHRSAFLQSWDRMGCLQPEFFIWSNPIPVMWSIPVVDLFILGQSIWEVFNIKGKGIETMRGCPKKHSWLQPLKGMLGSLTRSQTWVSLKTSCSKWV